MQDDVEKVARSVRTAKLVRMGHKEATARELVEADTLTAVELFEARAAMAATLELAAAELMEKSSAILRRNGCTDEDCDKATGLSDAADWLRQRANDVKETGRG